jgi:hypothetical protein
MQVPFNERVLCGVDEARAVLGNLGLTTFYGLTDINGGPIETTMIGRRRLVKVRSLMRVAEAGYNPQPANPPRPGAGRKAA